MPGRPRLYLENTTGGTPFVGASCDCMCRSGLVFDVGLAGGRRRNCASGWVVCAAGGGTRGAADWWVCLLGMFAGVRSILCSWATARGPWWPPRPDC